MRTRWRSCNVVGSTVAREPTGVLHLRAGPEIGVASTKAFTTQVAALPAGALASGRRRPLDRAEAAALVEGLRRAARPVEQVLGAGAGGQAAGARSWLGRADVFFLGRGLDYPVALEGR